MLLRNVSSHKDCTVINPRRWRHSLNTYFANVFASLLLIFTYRRYKFHFANLLTLQIFSTLHITRTSFMFILLWDLSLYDAQDIEALIIPVIR
jgi:hypothetical protein